LIVVNSALGRGQLAQIGVVGRPGESEQFFGGLRAIDEHELAQAGDRDRSDSAQA
jgi:hypothetical protein